MKKVQTVDGLAGWKLDSPVERFLAKAADKSAFAKYLYVNFYRVFDKEYYQKGLPVIEKTVRTFAGDVTPTQLRDYTYDMVYSLHRFGCSFNEYFYYNYENLNVQGRESFVTEKIRWGYYAKMNIEENKELFNNKRKAYEKFRPYYRREVIDVLDDGDKETFCTFLQKHKRVIVKPLYGSSGRGVFALSIDEFPDMDAHYAHIQPLLPVAVEEVLRQDPEMAKLHPESVNTVRVPTIKLKDKVVIFHPFMKIGCGSSVVDNGAQGGLLLAVDAETGIISMEASDVIGNRFLAHPDTGVILPGFQIPRWEEAKALATELALLVEGNHYMGWDLALSEEGWSVIEGNPRGMLVAQLVTQKGVRQELEDYIAQM